MSDYISTLTGPQMDAALIDMAEHNSEAYAVGERAGIPVDNDDVTFNNNARHYAQLAQSAVPGDMTSAVRWDIDQSSLTEADRAMARKNIIAGASNRNLLDNPWFTVNQRELTTMSSASYAMDRWKCDNAITNGMVYSDGIVTTASGTVFAQRLEPSLLEFLEGKVVTASILNADGTITSATNTVSSSGSTSFPYVGAIDRSPIRFRVNGGKSFKAAKIELGPYSTLANDVPPEYGTELAKCQRYFIRINGGNGLNIGNGYFRDATRFFTVLHLPTSMRATPTLSYSCTITVLTTSNITGSSISLGVCYGNIIDLTFTTTSSTAGAAGVAQISGGYIDLSADL